MIPNALIEFNLFGKTVGIHMYGVMIAIGLLVCFFVLFKYAKVLKIPASFMDFVFYVSIASIALGFVFATLFQSVLNYLKNPDGGFTIGGLTFLGGLIGGAGTFLLLYVIFRKKQSARICDILTMLPCCIMVAHGFGRIGCFFAGCCYGKVTDSFLGVVFPVGSSAYAGGDARHPTQLYEAVFLFIMFAILSVLVLKYKFKHGMSFYLIGYGIFRFLIEFLRDDDRGANIGPFTPSQFWSILMIIMGIALIFIHTKVLLKREQELAIEKKE